MMVFSLVNVGNGGCWDDSQLWIIGSFPHSLRLAPVSVDQQIQCFMIYGTISTQIQDIACACYLHRILGNSWKIYLHILTGLAYNLLSTTSSTNLPIHPQTCIFFYHVYRIQINKRRWLYKQHIMDKTVDKFIERGQREHCQIGSNPFRSFILPILE